MWIPCDGCGRKIRIRKKGIWMAMWTCKRCGYKNYKRVDPDAKPPFYKLEEMRERIEF